MLLPQRHLKAEGRARSGPRRLGWTLSAGSAPAGALAVNLAAEALSTPGCADSTPRASLTTRAENWLMSEQRGPG